METNRISLYQGLKEDGNITISYKDFLKKYFSDDVSITDLYYKLIDGGDYTKALNEFYTKYACDLDWAKTTKYCGSAPKKETEKTQGQQDKPVEKPNVTQQQQNLVAKGYFIGTSGPNKNGVDGVPGEKTQYAQHALDSGIDATTYNNNYKQLYPDLTQTIENLFGKQTPNEIPDNPKLQPKDDSNNKKVQPDDDSNNKKVQVQKARVIKTINPNDW
jgi:hypothetical protein